MAQYDSLVEYARLLAAECVTACLPTLLGSPQENVEAMRRGQAEFIRIWDVSPELDGAIPFIRWCRERGIVTSLAHSSASIEQARRPWTRA
jgi:N-acetylglucosamine-6-phosphate deacetylase